MVGKIKTKKPFRNEGFFCEERLVVVVYFLFCHGRRLSSIIDTDFAKA
jgi:hypothetical protein